MSYLRGSDLTQAQKRWSELVSNESSSAGINVSFLSTFVWCNRHEEDSETWIDMIESDFIPEVADTKNIKKYHEDS